MKKEKIKLLQKNAKNHADKIYNEILKATSKTPLVLFEPEKYLDQDEIPDDDDIYDYPYGSVVDKYGHHLSGAVQKIEGNMVTLFLVDGDEWGREYVTGLQDLPLDSQMDILNFLED